jgi:hypothetical protein
MTADDSTSRAKESDVERRRRLRNRKQVERYGGRHRRRRRELARQLEDGELLHCVLCRQPIGPDQQWQLGSTTGEAEHVECRRRFVGSRTSRRW